MPVVERRRGEWRPRHGRAPTFAKQMQQKQIEQCALQGFAHICRFNAKLQVRLSLRPSRSVASPTLTAFKKRGELRSVTRSPNPTSPESGAEVADNFN